MVLTSVESSVPEPKKTPKKLVIVDANETEPAKKAAAAAKKTIKKSITVTDTSGDTPALASKTAAKNTSAIKAKAKTATKSRITVIDKNTPDDTTPPAMDASLPTAKAGATVSKTDSTATEKDAPTPEADLSGAESGGSEPQLSKTMTIDEAMHVAGAASLAVESTKDDSESDATVAEAFADSSAEEVQADAASDPSNEPSDAKMSDSSETSAVRDAPPAASSTETAQDDVIGQEEPAANEGDTPPLPGSETPTLVRPPIVPKPGITRNIPPATTDIAPPPRTPAPVPTPQAPTTTEDEFLPEARPITKTSPGFKKLFKNWWFNPATKWGTLTGLVLLVLASVFLPVSRYFVLNTAGVRVSSSLTVLNQENQQPLKNADVTLGTQTAKTDENGLVFFKKLKLGPTHLTISKRGYVSVDQTKVLGWGSNPLGSVTLNVGGNKYSIEVKDYLSGKGIASAEAVSGEFNSQADKDGKILLAVDQNSDSDINVTIKADDYADAKVTIKRTDRGTKVVTMLPARQHIFVSKRSGKLDLYKVSIDGSDEKLLLAGTGSERNDITLLVHPSKSYAALVSTRDNNHNKDGYLLSGLFVINTDTGEVTKVSQSERIQLIDWTGDRIVFVAVTEGASAANPARSKLYSYEIGQPGPKTITSANYFNDVTVFKGNIYYAPSSYALPVSSIKFYKVNPDGSGQSALLDKEVWNILRADYDTLDVSVQQDWYQLKGTESPSRLSSAPAATTTRSYYDSPNGKNSLWVDQRDGKGVLLSYDVMAKKDTILTTQAGLGLPVSWLNNTTVVYRIVDENGTADYAKSIDGGDAKKIKDVTATNTSNYFH